MILQPGQPLPIGLQTRQQATTLATLIWSRKEAGEDLEYAAYEVIGEYMADWTDERKADIYAMLAEELSATMPFPAMVEAVSECIRRNIAWNLRA